MKQLLLEEGDRECPVCLQGEIEHEDGRISECFVCDGKGYIDETDNYSTYLNPRIVPKDHPRPKRAGSMPHVLPYGHRPIALPPCPIGVTYTLINLAFQNHPQL